MDCGFTGYGLGEACFRFVQVWIYGEFTGFSRLRVACRLQVMAWGFMFCLCSVFEITGFRFMGPLELQVLGLFMYFENRFRP